MRTVLMAMAFCAGAASAAAEMVGIRSGNLDMPHHGREAEFAVFYPGEGGEVERFGENPVFYGQDLARNAEIAEGRYPVVLVSHGMGGGVEPMTWLSAGLAREGAIVVAVKHPNSSFRDFDMSKGVRHWTRALDMSRALDHVLSDPGFAEHADMARVAAVGFSYGGWTALSLGGARGNHQGILDVCAEQSGEMLYCDVFMSDAIRLQDVDPEAWNASYRDPRVSHVFAIDPGFVWGIEKADVAELVPDVELIGLGSGAERMIETNFDASGFAGYVPQAENKTIAPAVHFSAMALCKPGGAAILAAEKDDPVCTDPVGADRAAIHAEIIGSISAKLGL